MTAESRPQAKKPVPVAFLVVMALSAITGYGIAYFFFKMPGIKESLPAFNALDALVFLILVLVVLTSSGI